MQEKITQERVHELARQSFGDMVKVVVDLQQEILAIGGELHADAEAILLENGSLQKDVWGANIYLDRPTEESIEYISLINIRPAQGNRSTKVEDPLIQEKIKRLIEKKVCL